VNVERLSTPNQYCLVNSGEVSACHSLSAVVRM